jgi:hypothetical protein
MILTILLTLACTTAYASMPGEEHNSPIFQDNFEDWDENAWDIGPSTSYGSYWKVMDDNGNMVLSVKGTVSIAAGAPYWADYTLIVKVKLVDAPEGVMIRVRLGEAGEGYSVDLSSSDFVFIKSLGWGSEPIYLTKLESLLNSGTWYTVKIVCIGNTFWVYIDNELRFEYKDESDPMLSGRINLGCGPNSNVYFDDFWVAVTYTDYVGYLITEAQLIIDEAKALDADVHEPEDKLKEAQAKLEEGDLSAAEGLAKGAAEKAKGILEMAASGGEEQQPEPEQPAPTQPSTTLSLERFATLLTIGGAITGVGGWALKTRSDRRKRTILFMELTQGVDDVYEKYQADAPRCEAELQRIKDRAINEYKKNLINERDYLTLEAKIKEYLRKQRETT